MSILLNPNVAYLVIVAGFLLTIFAILTPGTGFFEAGAITVLAVAAYQVYSLSVNIWALVLLVLGVIPFILAIRQKSITLNLALTLFAFVVGSAFLFRTEEWWRPAVHPVLAVVVSIAAGGFFWIIAKKSIEARTIKPSHDLGRLVGSEGETRTSVHTEGSVYAGGELWTAFSDQPIKSGKRVRILDRKGFLLHVEEIDD